MRLRYLLVILALLGGAYYFEIWPFQSEPPPAPSAASRMDPGVARSLRAAIRHNQRTIADLENQAWRSRRGTANDNTAQIQRDKKIAELRQENAILEGRLTSGR